MTDDNRLGASAEWKLDYTDHRLLDIQEQVDEGFLIAGADTRWMIERLRAYKHALVTCYWLVHGSEGGRAWEGAAVVESAIREGLVDGDG